MTLRPEFILPHPEFNAFLFATVGEEKNGSELTVLSALSRLGLDPWSEAERLSDLSNEKATSALASKIASLPEGHWKASDSRSIAGRLIQLLPSPGPARPKQTAVGDEQKPLLDLRLRILWIAIGAAILAYLLFQNIQ